MVRRPALVCLLLFLTLDPCMGSGNPPEANPPDNVANPRNEAEQGTEDHFHYRPPLRVPETAAAPITKGQQIRVSRIPALFRRTCEALGGADGFCFHYSIVTVSRYIGLTTAIVALIVVAPSFNMEKSFVGQYDLARNRNWDEAYEAATTFLGRKGVPLMVFVLFFVGFSLLDFSKTSIVDKDLNYNNGERFGRTVEPKRLDVEKQIYKIMTNYEMSAATISRRFADHDLNVLADGRNYASIRLYERWLDDNIMGVSIITLILSVVFCWLNGNGIFSKWSWFDEQNNVYKRLRFTLTALFAFIVFVYLQSKSLLGNVINIAILDLKDSFKRVETIAQAYITLGLGLFFVSLFRQNYMGNWLRLAAFPLILSGAAARCLEKSMETRLKQECNEIADEQDRMEASYAALRALVITDEDDTVEKFDFYRRINKADQIIQEDLKEYIWECSAMGGVCNDRAVIGPDVDKFFKVDSKMAYLFDSIKLHRFPFASSKKAHCVPDKQGVCMDRKASATFYTNKKEFEWWPILPRAKPRQPWMTGVNTCYRFLETRETCVPNDVSRRAEESSVREFECKLCAMGVGNMFRVSVVILVILGSAFLLYSYINNISVQLQADPINTYMLPPEFAYDNPFKLTLNDHENLPFVGDYGATAGICILWIGFLIIGTQLFGIQSEEERKRRMYWTKGEEMVRSFISPEARVFVNTMLLLGDQYGFWNDITRFSSLGGFAALLLDTRTPAAAASALYDIIRLTLIIHDLYGAASEVISKDNEFSHEDIEYDDKSHLKSYSVRAFVMLYVVLIIWVLFVYTVYGGTTNLCPRAYGWFAGEEAKLSWPGSDALCYKFTYGSEQQYNFKKAQEECEALGNMDFFQFCGDNSNTADNSSVTENRFGKLNCLVPQLASFSNRVEMAFVTQKIREDIFNSVTPAEEDDSAFSAFLFISRPMYDATSKEGFNLDLKTGVTRVKITDISNQYDQGDTETKGNGYICKMGKRRFQDAFLGMKEFGPITKTDNMAGFNFYLPHFLLVPIGTVLLVWNLMQKAYQFEMARDGSIVKVLAFQSSEIMVMFGYAIAGVLILPSIIQFWHSSYRHVPTLNGNDASKLAVLNAITAVVSFWQNVIIQTEPRYAVHNGRHIEKSHFWLTDWWNFLIGTAPPSPQFDPIHEFSH